jgi:putative ABC transport system permease protein
VFINHLKLSLRNIKRHKLFSFINIAGLAVGMACFILIMLWVQDEQSYDKFHANKDRLYLVTIIHPNEITDPNVPYALAPIMANEFPEILDYTRIYELGALSTCSFGYRPANGSSIMFYEDKVNLVDPCFFTMFSFPFKYGDPKTALQAPNSLVISEKIALKYFGQKNPLGEKLTFNNREDVIVTGVVRVPTNSHLQFDFVAPLRNKLLNDWNWRDPSYVLLNKDASLPAFRAKIAGILGKHSPFPKADSFKVDILPVSDIYLNFGRRTYVYLFSVIALFILFIACINYMNLATAGSVNRAREVGLRKVAGARRVQLVGQFLGESVLMSFLALLISLILVKLFLPLLNNLTAKQMIFAPFQGFLMFSLLLGLVIAVGIISGIYPAFFLTSSRPVDTLKGPLSFKSRHSIFRVVTVTGQFIISVLLIACTVVVFNQLNYIRERPLGFKTDYIIKVPMNRTLLLGFNSFKNELLQNPNILNVTASQAVPYDDDMKTDGVEWEGKDPGLVPLVRYSITDVDYVETFEMQIVDGRSFKKEYPADKNNYVINEEAAKYMGMDAPVGQQLKFWGARGTIIGVVKNFHSVSLHRKILPHILTINPRNFGALKYVFIKVTAENVPDTLRFISGTSLKYAPDYPFEYSFIDRGVGNLYQSEQKLGKIFGYFAFIAIFISCLGIFGLASFTAERRTKEIGIRKTLGASVSSIVVLLSKDFSRWVLLANIIAWPLGWYAMHKWLENFAYRVDPGLFLFIFAGVLSFITAALPIGFHSIKAATTNPVNTLRYE